MLAGRILSASYEMETAGFAECGVRLSTLGLPVVIVMECDNAIYEIGGSAVSFLNVFLNG